MSRGKGLSTAAIVIALAAWFGAFLVLAGAVGLARLTPERAPDQPIAFPHVTHVSVVGLPCLFCHADAARSRHAGVPPLQKCMDCHRAIATERTEIKKLTRHYDEKRPVEWVRVHALPDYIHFSHKRHVKGGLECRACHGDVGAMRKVRRVSTLKMGWCISCHKIRGAPTECATCHK